MLNWRLCSDNLFATSQTVSTTSTALHPALHWNKLSVSSLRCRPVVVAAATQVYASTASAAVDEHALCYTRLRIEFQAIGGSTTFAPHAYIRSALRYNMSTKAISCWFRFASNCLRLQRPVVELAFFELALACCLINGTSKSTDDSSS